MNLLAGLILTFLPNGAMRNYQTSEYPIFTEDYAIELQTGIEWLGFTAYGSQYTVFNKHFDTIYFFPNSQKYMFGLKYNYKNIEAGFKHFCFHPVTTYLNGTESKIMWDGAYEEIYVKFSGKISVF